MAARNAKTLLYIGGAGFGAYFLGSRMTDFKTPGVRNIERRHTAAGGAPNHTPASHTRMGHEDDVVPMQASIKGVGSKHFTEKIGDQVPEKGEIAKKWTRTHFDSDKGPRG